MTLRERSITVTSLARVCQEHALGPIDFLKVDAEGFERQVLAGGDWSRWRPRIVLVEDAWPELWEPQFLDAGYLLARRSRMNRFSVRVEDGDLAGAMQAPLGPNDDFALHRHAMLLASLSERFDRGEDFGPSALKLALWLRRQSIRHPFLASACRKIMRSAS